MAGCTVKKVLSKIRAFDGAPFFIQARQLFVAAATAAEKFPDASIQLPEKSNGFTNKRTKRCLLLSPDQNSMLEINMQSWLFFP
jgi:hypothetical protein